jgi:hypothetical protein
MFMLKEVGCAFRCRRKGGEFEELERKEEY